MRDEIGQSLVELALLLPILVFGLIGAADLARAFALQLAIQNGARAGAEAYAINFAPTPAMAGARALDEIQRTPGINVRNDANARPLVGTVWSSSEVAMCCTAAFSIVRSMGSLSWTQTVAFSNSIRPPSAFSATRIQRRPAKIWPT